MSIRAIHGDCREVLKTLPDESVHCVVTSPPYFGLRDYGTAKWEGGGDGCDHAKGSAASRTSTLKNDGRVNFGSNDYERSIVVPYRDECGKCGARRIDNQIGLEATPDAYVAELVAVFREVRRVLRNDGTAWINLGDSYAANRGYQVSQSKHPAHDYGGSNATKVPSGLKPKDLIGIPWMVAFALRADGWWLRQDIIWSKPNPMPESVTDRPTSAHEHIFLFAKSARYYFDAEAVKEPDVAGHKSGNGYARVDTKNIGVRLSYGGRGQEEQWEPGGGRNIRNVWTVATQPFSEAHFACVDETTECLTDTGWARHDALSPGMRAAQFDLSTGYLSWAPISEVARYAVTEQKMVRADTRSLDMLLTPNHRCIVQRRHPRLRHYQDPVVVRADELKISHAVPTTAPWDFIGDAGLPVEWAELLGWYIAEGHEAKQTLAVEIYQSETANPEKVQRIEQLLRQVGAEWTSARCEREWRGRSAVSVAFRVQGYAAARLRELAPGKRMPTGVLLWADEQISAFLKGLVEGDGHERSDGRSSFIQRDASRAGMVQALAVRLGLSAVSSVRADGVSVVYITKHRFRSFRGTAGVGVHPTAEIYTGTVWCPRLPNGTWVARRNGRVFITGNTFPPALIEPCIKAGCPARACAKCGKPWVREVERVSNGVGPYANYQAAAGCPTSGGEGTSTLGYGGKFVAGHKTLGFSPSCSCNAATVPGTCLDPFAGAGTTGLVADRLGRNAVLIELNEDYSGMSRRRIHDDAPLFAEVLA